jgi:hypothetical protein
MISRVTWRVTARKGRYDDSPLAEKRWVPCYCRRLPLSVPVSLSWAPYGHSHLSAWMFGGVTRTVLSEAGLPVLMSR